MNLYNNSNKLIIYLQYLINLICLYAVFIVLDQFVGTYQSFYLIGQQGQTVYQQVQDISNYDFFLNVAIIILSLSIVLSLIGTFFIEKDLNYLIHISINLVINLFLMIKLSSLMFRLNSAIKPISITFNVKFTSSNKIISITTITNKSDYQRLIYTIYPNLPNILNHLDIFFYLEFTNLVLLSILAIYRLQKETRLFSRMKSNYRQSDINMTSEEFIKFVRGLMKFDSVLDLNEMEILTDQSIIFWKKKIYSIIGSTQIVGTFEGNKFILESKSSKEEFIYELGSSIDLEMDTLFQTGEIPNIVSNRRCCQLNGRLGDTYCNLCGRAIPEEFLVH